MPHTISAQNTSPSVISYCKHISSRVCDGMFQVWLNTWHHTSYTCIKVALVTLHIHIHIQNLIMCAYSQYSPSKHSPVIGCRQECFTGGHFDIPHHIRVAHVLLQTQLGVHLPQLDQTVGTTCDQRQQVLTCTDVGPCTSAGPKQRVITWWTEDSVYEY